MKVFIACAVGKTERQIVLHVIRLIDQFSSVVALVKDLKKVKVILPASIKFIVKFRENFRQVFNRTTKNAVSE